MIHVQPRASATEVVGRHGDAIKIRLKSPPVENAANEELVRFLADRFGLSREAVRVVSGATTRRKRVRVEGIDQTAAERALGLTTQA